MYESRGDCFLERFEGSNPGDWRVKLSYRKSSVRYVVFGISEAWPRMKSERQRDRDGIYSIRHAKSS